MHRPKVSAQAILKLSFMVIALLTVITGCGGGGGGGSAPSTYSISGTVSGATVEGVTINLTGTATASTTTGADGKFNFTGRANGIYQVTAVQAGFKFNPITSRVVVSGANVTNVDFAATVNVDPTYSLSGKVSGVVQANVVITLSGGATGTTQTDASGNYSFSGLVNGSYTVTPSLTGYIFEPDKLDITISGSSLTNQNFTSKTIPVPTYTLSGTISGETAEGVTVNLTGAATASTTTGADGSYSFTELFNGSYTVTPVKTGFTFTDSSRTVTVSGANITGIDFVAAVYVEPTYTISGTVSGVVLEGVTMTLSGAGSASTTTNASGNYSFPNLVNGSYTVTPSKAGNNFSPASSVVVVSGANRSGINFGSSTAYTQADLTGTWNVHTLQTVQTGSSNKWFRGVYTFNSTGNLTAASSCQDPAGPVTCPVPGALTWTISPGGVIAESTNKSVHMTMTSTKNFIAGTSSSAIGSYPQLQVIQKVIPGTDYSNAFLQGKSLVFHELIVGSETKWRYGIGSTSAMGAVTLTSQVLSSGAPEPDSWGTLSVDTTGVVTIIGIPTFSGFLADDKKTIVGTYTSGTTYRLMILQITARNDYPAGLLPESTWKSSILAKSTSTFAGAGWVYCTNTVNSSGNMSFSDWTSDNPLFQNNPPSGTFTGSLTSTGQVTMSGSNYHGQASDDWNFLVGTMTMSVGTINIYFLQISTR